MELWDNFHWVAKLAVWVVGLGASLIGFFLLWLFALAISVGKIEDPEDYNGDHL